MTAGADAANRRVWHRVAVVVVATVALVGCQLDVTADVVVQPDGSGEVVVTATANAELVERVPTIADDLVLDDFAEAGWAIDGPNPTPDGGLVLVLSHDFEGHQEATSLLRSLGPPFNDVAIGRREDGDTATNAVSGNLILPDGFASFADDDLVAAVGSVPFADQFEQEGADPATDLTATLIVTLPGNPVGDTNAEEVDGRLRWSIPTDGSRIEATAETEQAPSSGSAWARPVANVALIALIAWVSFMTIFILYVAVARARRARRYRRRALP